MADKDVSADPPLRVNETGAAAPSRGREELMAIWRRALTMDDTRDPSEVVVAELSDYFQLPPDEVRHRCVNWKTYSTQEWLARDRSSPDGLLDFYQTQVSWIFDTMWYHANQWHGSAPAETVEIAHGLDLPPGTVLDFGAGPGSSALFYHKLGWQVALADVSTTMLNFARWRLERHHVPATFIDTSRERLPSAAYDLITAFDVMVHVPYIRETLAEMHRALRPGGYLVFNIDNQPATLENHGHLYADQWPILRQVRVAGFRRLPKITYFHVYQKVERGTLDSWLIWNFDHARYNPVATRVGNLVRGVRRRVAGPPRDRW